MKKFDFSARRLAVAGIGTAISVLFLLGAFYIPNVSISFNILASLGIMMPLSQKYYRESILTYVAASGLGAIFANIHILPFVLITGSYTLFALISHEKKVKPYIVFPVCFLYGLLCFFILYYLTKIISIDMMGLKLENFNPVALYVILNAIFSACMVIYHFGIIWLYKYVAIVFKKINKK